MMIPSLFSVSYAGLWGQHRLDTKNFIKKAAKLGYTAVQIACKKPHIDFNYISDKELNEINVVAKKNKIDIHTIAAYNDFTSGKGSLGTPFVDMQIGYIKTACKIAKKLKAKQVRIFSGYFYDTDNYMEEWTKCVKAVRECAAVAEDYGVFLGLQNHHDVGVSSESYIEFLADVNHPNCKAMFDPWAPAIHGDDLRAVGKKLAPLMIQTTLADYIKLRRFTYQPGIVNYKQLPEIIKAVPVGCGFIDNKAFFEGLKEGGFNGYVVYEMCSPLKGGGTEANLDKTAKISLDAIKNLVS